jgi:predicted double-glycine peptidase
MRVPSFKLWIIMEKREILDSIKVPLQSVRQTTKYSCGAAALRSIFQYFKVGPDEEEKFIKMMNTNYHDGTRPKDIVATARDYGLCVKQKHNMTVRQLKNMLDLERPVIVPIQAYGSKKYYKKRQSGHYVVAIGYDDEAIFFEDPVLKGRRGYLTYEEFDERWYDQDADGEDYDHYGIIIWKPDGDERDSQYLSKARKID